MARNGSTSAFGELATAKFDAHCSVPHSVQRPGGAGDKTGGDGVLAEEVRITGRHHGVDRKPARVTVIGVQPVSAPGVVAQHDRGLQPPDPTGDLATSFERAVELAVDVGVECSAGVEDPARDVGSPQAPRLQERLHGARGVDGDDRGQSGTPVPASKWNPSFIGEK